MKKNFVVISVALATFVVSGQAVAQIDGGVTGLGGTPGGITVSNPPSPAVVPAPQVTAPSTAHVSAPHRSRTPYVAQPTHLPNGQMCGAEFNRLRSGMNAALRCLTAGEWARLEQLCGPHGLSVDRAFSRYTREHCAALDLNVLGRVSGAPVQPECLGNAHPVVERGRTVDCACDEGMTAMRLWSRRNARPRVDCFSDGRLGEITVRNWVRSEIADVRDSVNALCRPSEGQSLVAACGELRTRLDAIMADNDTPVAPLSITPATPGTAPDLSGIQAAVDVINNALNTEIRPQIHDLTCRLLRAEGREMPADCTDIPALPPRPATPSASSEAVHHFDFSFANALAVFRFGGGPLSVGAGMSGAWRYRFPGSHNLSFYVRGEAAYGDMGSDIGAVGLFGGGMGLAYQPSENVHLLLGLSVRSYGQPGDSTLRPASGAYRGLDAGVEAALRRYMTSSVFAELGVQLHYGEAVMIAPPAFPGGPNQDFHWTGTALAPRVGLGITF